VCSIMFLEKFIANDDVVFHEIPLEARTFGIALLTVWSRSAVTSYNSKSALILNALGATIIAE
jgi:hypothetical protein